MKKRVQRLSISFAVILLVLFVSIASVIWIYDSILGQRQREAENILFYYREKIILQLQGTINEATALAQTAHAMDSIQVETSEWFETVTEPLLSRAEVHMVCLDRKSVV